MPGEDRSQVDQMQPHHGTMRHIACRRGGVMSRFGQAIRQGEGYFREAFGREEP